MKILNHDFCGHPFTLTLSVEFADRGHSVDHVYFASETGPKGDFAAAAAQPRPARMHGLAIDGQYRKDAFLSRRSFDLNYARQLHRLILELKPDVLLSSNCPTEVQDYVMHACRKTGTAFVFWMQDFYSIAATKLLSKKLGVIGRAIGGYWRWLDRKHLRAADWIVLITEDFRDLASSWARNPDKIDVVENWGAIGEIPRRARDNPWARAHGIGDEFHFLYSGTLGLKHNPELLAALAKAISGRGRVTVTSMGASLPYLERRKHELALDNLTLLPLQPFADVPEMLGSADAFVATIEPDAGTFSVPSKVLSYLCAGRPIVLAAPADNLATKIVTRAGAGRVVSPDDEAGFLAAALGLLNASDRGVMGDRGRAYAEEHFDIANVATRFEGIFEKALVRKRGK
ncbi:glycosyltransferase family 4 protein [Sphingomonas oryzagri]